MTKAQKRKQEKLALLRRMHLDGAGREEIAEAAGYTVQTVSEYLSDMGLLRRRKDDRLEKILQFHDDGKSLKEISSAVGLSMGRVSAILGKNGRRRVAEYGIRDREPVHKSLIDENTVYADNAPRIFYIHYRGKDWMDITELIARR